MTCQLQDAGKKPIGTPYINYLDVENCLVYAISVFRVQKFKSFNPVLSS